MVYRINYAVGKLKSWYSSKLVRHMGSQIETHQKFRLIFRSKIHRATLYLLIFAVSFVIFLLSGEGHPNNYDYYVRLADAFLHGRLYLLERPPWLSELIPFEKGYYVVYPPLPAVLMMPLVAIFGLSLNQTLISVFFGSLSVVLANIVARDAMKKGKNGIERKDVYLWPTVLFGFGTIFWWLASVGSVWLIAQVMSVFFLFLALHETFNKRRPLLMGLFVGASFWCRLPTIVSIVFFAAVIISSQPNQSWKGKIWMALPSLLKLGVGAGVFVTLNMLYNLARFGTPFDVGYWLIPNILNEPMFSEGLFSLSYIPCNLKAFLAGTPVFVSGPPFVLVPISGLAIWLTTPAFVYALRSKIRDVVTGSCWLAIVAVAFVIFSKGLSGWGFGYRYAVDFYPFLYVLTVKGMGEKVMWHHKVLIILSVLVNLWGIIWVTKFGLITW